MGTDNRSADIAAILNVWADKGVNISDGDRELAAKKPEEWEITSRFSALQDQLDEIARWYLLRHPSLMEVAKRNDPAIRDKNGKEAFEELLTYPWLAAIGAHEIAHHLYNTGNSADKVIARKLAEAAHSRSGIDIHPGTRIGENCFIDHGTGDVIGETAEIGRNTMIYHGVTLGAHGNPKDINHRHPVVGHDCIISAGTKVLGNVHIGNDVKIGAQVSIIGNSIKIEDGVEIKPNVQIMDKNTIAHGMKIGAGAIIPYDTGVIDIDVPPHSQVIRDNNGELHILSLAQHESDIAGLLDNAFAGLKGYVGRLASEMLSSPTPHQSRS